MGGSLRASARPLGSLRDEGGGAEAGTLRDESRGFWHDAAVGAKHGWRRVDTQLRRQVTMEDMLDLVVTGEVLVEGVAVPASVGMAGGRIVFLGRPQDAPPARQRLDRSGCWLLPGALDVHVHTLSTPAEGITRATAAAAAGG